MHNGSDVYRRRLAHLRDVGRRYWSQAERLLDSLPVPQPARGPAHRWVEVALPEWASDLGVGSRSTLLVDAGTVVPGDQAAWMRTDWWAAAFYHLHSVFERRHEAEHGPIHSYSFRLAGAEPRLFERAWVNRIFLWLRRWAAVQARQHDDAVFGPKPLPEFELSHDVDAVAKSFNIRGKQTAFHLINAGRLVRQGRWTEALTRARCAARFAVSRDDYWRFDELCALEQQAGLRGTFHFHAGEPGLRSPKRWLFDPAYDIAAPRMRQQIRTLLDGGWQIGVHPGFDCWRDATALARDCERLRQVAGCEVTRCRQHWLRFSWQETWRAQEQAGICFDGTLGFNDRLGFRNGAALQFKPWDFAREQPMGLTATPLVLMDSHLYDYHLATGPQAAELIGDVLEEVRFVGGCAGVLWHPHTLSDDYGWKSGFRGAVEQVRRCERQQALSA